MKHVDKLSEKDNRRAATACLRSRGTNIFVDKSVFLSQFSK